MEGFVTKMVEDRRFGFIDAVDGDSSIFFHFNEVFPRDQANVLKVGDEVEFELHADRASDKTCGKQVRRLPAGSIKTTARITSRPMFGIIVQPPTKSRAGTDTTRLKTGPHGMRFFMGSGLLVAQRREGDEKGAVPGEVDYDAVDELLRSGVSEADVSTTAAGKSLPFGTDDVQDPTEDGIGRHDRESWPAALDVELFVGDEVEYTEVWDKRTKHHFAVDVAVIRSPFREMLEQCQQQEYRNAFTVRGIVTRITAFRYGDLARANSDGISGYGGFVELLGRNTSSVYLSSTVIHPRPEAGSRNKVSPFTLEPELRSKNCVELQYIEEPSVSCVDSDGRHTQLEGRLVAVTIRALPEGSLREESHLMPMGVAVVTKLMEVHAKPQPKAARGPVFRRRGDRDTKPEMVGARGELAFLLPARALVDAQSMESVPLCAGPPKVHRTLLQDVLGASYEVDSYIPEDAVEVHASFNSDSLRHAHADLRVGDIVHCAVTRNHRLGEFQVSDVGLLTPCSAGLLRGSLSATVPDIATALDAAAEGPEGLIEQAAAVADTDTALLMPLRERGVIVTWTDKGFGFVECKTRVMPDNPSGAISSGGGRDSNQNSVFVHAAQALPQPSFDVAHLGRMNHDVWSRTHKPDGTMIPGTEQTVEELKEEFGLVDLYSVAEHQRVDALRSGGLDLHPKVGDWVEFDVAMSASKPGSLQAERLIRTKPMKEEATSQGTVLEGMCLPQAHMLAWSPAKRVDMSGVSVSALGCGRGMSRGGECRYCHSALMYCHNYILHLVYVVCFLPPGHVTDVKLIRGVGKAAGELSYKMTVEYTDDTPEPSTFTTVPLKDRFMVPGGEWQAAVADFLRRTDKNHMDFEAYVRDFACRDGGGGGCCQLESPIDTHGAGAGFGHCTLPTFQRNCSPLTSHTRRRR